MDSPCIKPTVCKVLKIFQHGKYLVAYVLKRFYSKTKLSCIAIILSRILLLIMLHVLLCVLHAVPRVGLWSVDGFLMFLVTGIKMELCKYMKYSDVE